MANTNTDDLGFEDELFDEDPFGEEFDKDDVVNSRPGTDEDEYDEDEDEYDEEGYENEELPDVDINSILNYDEERRKSDHFEKEFLTDEEDNSNDEILQKNFKDYLVARKISGKLEGIGSDARIPSERIIESGKKVEISDDPSHIVKGDKKTTIVVQRNEDGEITNIEVLCSCGEKTTIALDFGDTGAEADDDIVLMEQDKMTDFGLDDNFNNLNIGDEVFSDSFEGEGMPSLDEQPPDEPLGT